MKVLYDFDGFKSKYGGVARCTVELIANLPQDIKYELAINVSKNSYLLESGIAPNISDKFLDRNNFICKTHFRGKDRLFDFLEKRFPQFPSYLNINKPISIDALCKHDFDVFHCPSTDCDTYFLEFLRNKPFVLTVHDMITEIFNSSGNQTRVKKLLIPRAAHIVTVSQNTKNDLLKYFDVPEEKVTVIYHGAPDTSKFENIKLDHSPYFLYVGTRQSYKNFTQTVKDFAQFRFKHKDVSLIVAGGGDFNKEELALIRKYKLEDVIEHYIVTEQMLYTLYKNAIAFIFPSLYEGFGIPILESLSSGCPLLLNDTSCFPEIAGDAAIYFHSRPSENLSNLSEKMEYIYNMSSIERAELIEHGLHKASMFSWQNASNKLAEVFRQVVDGQ